MSSSEPALPNDPYAWIDRYAADLHQAARALARTGEASGCRTAVAQLLTAAIRLYFAKPTAKSGRSTRHQEDVEPLTATEFSPPCRSCCGCAWRPMELALWYRAVRMKTDYV